tara:strand:- start:373 stop:1368 length:996 start_codon:yes stop_codon:yes gene_type:complete
MNNEGVKRMKRCLIGLVIFLIVNSVYAQVPELPQKEFEKMVKELSNWGRWGKADQLGALNLITPEKRLEAARLVKHGISVSLANPAATEITADNPDPYFHTMLRHGKTEGMWAVDELKVSYHGFAHTHMDSLCHLFYKGKLYNGYSRREVTEKGAQKLSIHNVQQGVFTRGVLIDIPALRGVDYLEPGEAIMPEELVAWENRIGTKVQPGDVVFIRTGRWAAREAKGPWSVDQSGAAGLYVTCARWIKERDIAMLGSDAGSDVAPSRVEGVTHPIHILSLHAMGIHIFDCCNLEALHQTSQKLKRWDFLIQAAPIPVKGGTGSPLNPIATF